MDLGARREEGAWIESAAAAAGALLFVVLLYVGSIGPLARLCDEHRRTCRAIEPALVVVYTPLIWAAHETPLRAPLEWYIEDVWGAR
jgi:hypothetical protein